MKPSTFLLQPSALWKKEHRDCSTQKVQLTFSCILFAGELSLFSGHQIMHVNIFCGGSQSFSGTILL